MALNPYRVSLVWSLRAVGAVAVVYAAINAAWMIAYSGATGAQVMIAFSVMSGTVGALGCLALAEALAVNGGRSIGARLRLLLVWLLRGIAVVLAVLGFPTLFQSLSDQVQYGTTVATVSYTLSTLLLPAFLLLAFAEVLLRANEKNGHSQ